ncbi:hypothetical protein FHG87_011187 [Trinorchestia longiramus]|nr:hypothetical protein FHG87_011187 [Trinorchestia longiramus]
MFTSCCTPNGFNFECAGSSAATHLHHHHHQRRSALEGDRQQHYEQHHSFFVTKALQAGSRRSHVLESPADEGFEVPGADTSFWRRSEDPASSMAPTGTFLVSADKSGAAVNEQLEQDDEEGLIDDNEDDYDDDLPVDPDDEESDDSEDDDEGRRSVSRDHDSDRDEEDDVSDHHDYPEPDVVASSELDSSHEDDDVSDDEGRDQSSSRYHAMTRRNVLRRPVARHRVSSLSSSGTGENPVVASAPLYHRPPLRPPQPRYSSSLMVSVCSVTSVVAMYRPPASWTDFLLTLTVVLQSAVGRATPSVHSSDSEAEHEIDGELA